MNKLIAIIMLTISMSTIQSSAQEKKPSNSPLSKNFGKTHFIVGSSSEAVQQALDPDGILSTKEISPDVEQESSTDHAYFSPDDGLQKILLDLIGQEKSSIKIAVFLFTDGDIAQALLKAKEHGIAIEIVTDHSCVQDRFNKIKMLRKEGIPIYVYKPEESTGLFGNRMHHKFIIFENNKDGGPLLWFGSFNLTKTADRNQEAIVKTKNRQLIKQFSTQFDRLKERSVAYKQKKTVIPETKTAQPVVAKNFRTPTKRVVRKAKHLFKEIIT